MNGGEKLKDIYNNFAYDYDEFGPIEEYLGDERDFLNTLFSKCNATTVLDCACGAGQHLYMLLKSGYEVSGSDYSASMLQVAKKNLEDHHNAIFAFWNKYLITVLTLLCALLRHCRICKQMKIYLLP